MPWERKAKEREAVTDSLQPQFSHKSNVSTAVTVTAIN